MVETRSQAEANREMIHAPMAEPNQSEGDSVQSQIQQLRVTMEENKALALAQAAMLKEFAEMRKWIQRLVNPDSCDDPLAELKELKEISGIMEYHHRFELISARLDLPEECLISAYLDGLRPDTQTHVKMWQPKSVRDCLLLGKLYEKTQLYLKKASNQINQETEEVREANEEESIQEVKEEDEEKLIQEEKIREAVEEESVHEVLISDSERCLQFCKESLEVFCDLEPCFLNVKETVDTKVKITEDLSKYQYDIDIGKVSTHQEFVEMLVDSENYSKQKLILFSKNWRFKFKNQHRTERSFEVGDWVYGKLQPYRKKNVVYRSNNKLSQELEFLSDEQKIMEETWKEAVIFLVDMCGMSGNYQLFERSWVHCRSDMFRLLFKVAIILFYGSLPRPPEQRFSNYVTS